MKTTTLLTLALTALTLTPALRAEDTKPINPALLYWQAAAALPQLTTDETKEMRDLAAGRRAFDAAVAAKHLADGKATLRLVRKAADSPAPCVWGLVLDDGPFTLLPHLGKMQEMSSLAILQAETLFTDGKIKEGLDWLLVAHRMARHAGVDNILISNLVQASIETNALRAAARHCLAWDENTRQSYAAMLKTLPPLHSTQAAYDGERLLIDWIDRRFSGGTEAVNEVLDFVKMQVDELLKSSKITDTPLDKEALAAELTPAAVKAALPEMRSLQSRVEAVLGKPWAQSQPELEALVNEATHSQHLLVRSSFPIVMPVAEKQFILATLRIMLDAALEHGPQLDEAAAAAYHDAFESDPLRLKKNDDGTLTLLASHQHPAKKDLSLQIGK